MYRILSNHGIIDKTGNCIGNFPVKQGGAVIENQANAEQLIELIVNTTNQYDVILYCLSLVAQCTLEQEKV